MEHIEYKYQEAIFNEIYRILKPKGIFRRPMDNSRFVSLSSFKFTQLSEGIDKTCKWVKNNSES